MVVWLDQIFPERGMKISPLHQSFRIRFHHRECERRIVAWYKAELERLDPDYALDTLGLRFAGAERVAEEAGISPDNPQYSILINSMMDPREEARVHSEILEQYRRTGGIRMRRLATAVDMDDAKDYPQERVDAVTKACMSALKRKD
ncbi:MAG: hypothetical protein WCT41_03055 [Candidatus Paceibacterota bacterium]